MCPERKIQLLARQNSISVKVAVERAREWRFRPKAAVFHKRTFSREATFFLCRHPFYHVLLT
jgi:hypothetical protein